MICGTILDSLFSRTFTEMDRNFVCRNRNNYTWTDYTELYSDERISELINDLLFIY